MTKMKKESTNVVSNANTQMLGDLNPRETFYSRRKEEHGRNFCKKF